MVKKLIYLNIIILITTYFFYPLYIYAEDNLREIDYIQEAEKYYQKGKSLLAEGNYQEANKAFKQAEEAINQFNKLHQKKDKKRDALVDKKDKLKKTSNPQKKISSSKKKFSYQKKAKELLIKAKEAYNKNNWEEALYLYKKLSYYYPNNPDLHYNLGVLYLKKKDYLNAVDEFEVVIKLNKRDAQAYYNLGVIYENFLRDKIKAVKMYENYIRFGSNPREKAEVKKWIEYIEKEIK